MYSQATTNMRQRPMLTRPRTNIDGSQTARFIALLLNPFAAAVLVPAGLSAVASKRTPAQRTPPRRASNLAVNR